MRGASSAPRSRPDVTVRVRAGWIVPVVGPVVRDGWLDVDVTRGEIVGLGAGTASRAEAPDLTLDLTEAVILPGLVNAHTHLELSHLAGRVPPTPDFVSWVRQLLAVRFAGAPDARQAHAAIESAILAMEATGTAAVGDIGNSDASLLPLGASTLAGVHFREALGFTASEAGRLADDVQQATRRAHHELCATGNTRLAPSVAPHAPYSTSAPLIRALAGGYAPSGRGASMHLAESREELEFLANGTGAFRDLLMDLGAWDAAWTPPGLAPVPYLQQIGALQPGLLVVHGTQLTRPELAALAEAGATLVLCARSNAWVGAGTPPVRDAVASGGRLAVGTDSLASVADLNLFAELAALRSAAPEVSASTLLRAATWGGAQALGCRTLGYLGPGASSRAVVRVPPRDVADVEEWLVAGATDTSDLRWLDEAVTSAANR